MSRSPARACAPDHSSDLAGAPAGALAPAANRAPVHAPLSGSTVVHRRAARRHGGLGIALGLGAVLAAASPAKAATSVTVGLLGIDGSSAPPGMGQTVTDTLRRLVPELSGMQVKPHSQDPVEVKAIFDCQDERPACMAQIGRSLSVNRLIYGTVKRQGAGAFIIQLKQLNVADATVDKFVNETVQPAVLSAGNPQLDALVQRWLHVLLVEGLRGGLKVTTEPAGAQVLLDGAALGQTPLVQNDVEVGDHVLRIELPGHGQVVRTVHIRGGQVHEVTAQLAQRATGERPAPPPKPSEPINWSRVLRYSSYVLYGIAGASAIAAVGTWRGYIAAEDRASTSLDMLQRQLTEQGRAGMYGSFFGSAQRLSSCQGDPSLVGNPSYDAYLGDCQSGNAMARATTGLWITAASVAALGLTSTVLSRMLHRPDPKLRNERAGQPAGDPSQSPSTTPGEQLEVVPAPKSEPGGVRLEQLGAIAGPSGFGVSAALRF